MHSLEWRLKHRRTATATFAYPHNTPFVYLLRIPFSYFQSDTIKKTLLYHITGLTKFHIFLYKIYASGKNRYFLRQKLVSFIKNDKINRKFCYRHSNSIFYIIILV